MTLIERHDRAVLYTTAGLIALLPFIATFGHRGYATAMLIIGFVIATEPHVWRAGAARFLKWPDRRDAAALSAWSFAAFSVYLLVSGLWSDIDKPWKVWSNFTFTALSGGALVHDILRRAERDARGFRVYAAALILSTAVAVALLAFEAVTGGALRKAVPPPDVGGKDMISLARGLTAVIPSLFAVAALVVLWRRRIGPLTRMGIGAGFALAALASALNSVAANGVALFAGALAFLAAAFAPRATLRGLGAFIVLTTAAAPLAALLPAQNIAARAHLETSWAQRLFIYKKGGEAAIACAPFGCGADYGRAVSREGELVQIPGGAERLPVMPLHPHNIFLQIWMDLGIVGAAAFAAFAWFGLNTVAKLEAPRVFFGAAAGVIASLLVSAMIEASLWQNWRIAAAGFAAAALAAGYGCHRLHLNSATDRNNPIV